MTFQTVAINIALLTELPFAWLLPPASCLLFLLSLQRTAHQFVGGFDRRLVFVEQRIDARGDRHIDLQALAEFIDGPCRLHTFGDFTHLADNLCELSAFS